MRGGWELSGSMAIGEVEMISGGAVQLENEVSATFQNGGSFSLATHGFGGSQSDDVVVGAVVPVARSFGVEAIGGVEMFAFYQHIESLADKWCRQAFLSGPSKTRGSG